MLEQLDQEIADREQHFSFDPNEVYYYNAQRSQPLILSLQKRYDNFDTKHIYELFQKHLGVWDIKDVRFNTTFGTWHVVAFVDTSDHTYVYRQTLDLPEPESYMLMEQELADKFKSIGIGSVDILAFGAEEGYEWQIMEVLPGENVKEFKWTQEEYDIITFQIGRIAAMQYHLPMQWWGRIVKVDGQLQWYQKTHYDHFTAYLDYDFGVMKLSQLLTEADIPVLKEHLMGERVKEVFANTQSYLIDNDLPDHNVRFDKDTLRVLAIYDLESAVVYDPICELGSLPTWTFPYPKKQKLIEWFRSYIKTAGLEDKVDLSHFEEKIALYFLRTILWKMPMAIKGKKLSSKHIRLFREAIADNKLNIELNPEAVKILVGDR